MSRLFSNQNSPSSRLPTALVTQCARLIVEKEQKDLRAQWKNFADARFLTRFHFVKTSVQWIILIGVAQLTQIGLLSANIQIALVLLLTGRRFRMADSKSLLTSTFE
jgi:hypothetical protein